MLRRLNIFIQAKYFISIIAFLLVNIINSQTATPPKHILDSLKQELKTIKNDTTRCHILSLLALHSADDEMIQFNNDLLSFTEQKLKNIKVEDPNKNFYRIKLALAKNNAGFFASRNGDMLTALNLYKEALVLRQELDDKSGVAVSLGCIGEIYSIFGDIPKALDNYSSSLKIL